jgi:hypothetical protein
MKTVTLGLFALGGLAIMVVSWLSRRENSRIPSFGDLTGFVMAYQVGRVPVGRVAVLGFWWWIGWHFFAR